MQAKDVMTTPVVTANPETTVVEIAKRLIERKISAVPVVDGDNHVIGIVSEGDLMRRPESGTERHPSWWLELIAAPQEQAREYIKTHGSNASDVMTRDPVTVGEDASLEAIATLLEKHRIKRVPVLRSGRLVGIVSRANLLQGVVARRHAPQPSVDDRVLRECVLRAIRDSGAVAAFVDVVVTEGVLGLWGATYTETERDAIRLAATATPGVKGVEFHVGVFPPMARASMWT